MRIAQIAPLVESVPPKGYGGSEQVVSDLSEELVKRGHQVTLFASEDSVTAGRLIACAPQGLRRAGIPSTRWSAYDLGALLKFESMADQFEVVHNHMGYMALPSLSRLRCANVTTLHNPIKDYCRDIFLAFKQLPYVAISNTYRDLNYAGELNYVATVYNGISLSGVSTKDAPRSFLLFMGRICSDKGTREAISIAQSLELPIVIAGKVDSADRDYFDKFIRPFLSTRGVTFLGEVNNEEKWRLYGSAIATLCPLAFDEPFGLVMAESLAAGTPVVALRRGAVSEIVVDKETGIVGSTVDELISRFGELRSISSDQCRLRAASLFSKERMAMHYEEVYKRLLDLSHPHHYAHRHMFDLRRVEK